MRLSECNNRVGALLQLKERERVSFLNLSVHAEQPITDTVIEILFFISVLSELKDFAAFTPEITEIKIDGPGLRSNHRLLS